jgi:hypothetical protein
LIKSTTNHGSITSQTAVVAAFGVGRYPLLLRAHASKAARSSSSRSLVVFLGGNLDTKKPPTPKRAPIVRRRTRRRRVVRIDDPLLPSFSHTTLGHARAQYVARPMSHTTITTTAAGIRRNRSYVGAAGEGCGKARSAAIALHASMLHAVPAPRVKCEQTLG